jgi:hypothetical protein
MNDNAISMDSLSPIMRQDVPSLASTSGTYMQQDSSQPLNAESQTSGLETCQEVIHERM